MNYPIKNLKEKNGSPYNGYYVVGLWAFSGTFLTWPRTRIIFLQIRIRTHIS